MTDQTDEAPEGWTYVDIFVYVNEDGDAAADCDDDTAYEDFNDNIGGENRKRIKVRLLVKKPQTVIASATLPEDASECTFTFNVA